LGQFKSKGFGRRQLHCVEYFQLPPPASHKRRLHLLLELLELLELLGLLDLLLH